MKSPKLRSAMGTTALMACLFMMGCAGIQESGDPWLRAERVDFTQQASLFGRVIVQGFEGSQWGIRGYLKDLETGDTLPLSPRQSNFYLNVDPGKYMIHIDRLEQSSSGYNYTSYKHVDLDMKSQVFEVRAGDAVYVGDIMIYLGNPKKEDLGNDLANWVQDVLGGPAEQSLKIGAGVKDRSYLSYESLTERHPYEDYNYRTELTELTAL